MLKFAGLPVHGTWSKPQWETRYMCDLVNAGGTDIDIAARFFFK